MSGEPVVVVGIPHGGAVTADWAVAWENLRLPPGTRVTRALRQPVHTARNQIIATVLACVPDATHVFFLDDDTAPPPDGLLRLLDAATRYDAPVVSGLVTQRTPPYLPCAYMQAPNGEYVHLAEFVTTEGALQAVDGCGAACLLVRVDVLRALAGAYPRGAFAWERGFSEDLVFCQRVRQAGYRIALLPSVRATHLGVLDATYERYLDERQAGHVAYASAELALLAQAVRPW